MARSLPVLLVAFLLSLPTRGAQHIHGLERMLTAPVPSPAGGSQWPTAAATNGRDFRVTWHNRGSFYVTRLAPLATADEAGPKRIDVDGMPRVAAMGTQYVVAWKEQATIFAGALTESGGVPSRVALGTLEPEEDIASLTANASQMIIVVVDWSRDRMRVRLLGPDGHPDGDWIALGSIESWHGSRGIDVGADPAGFLILNIESQSDEPQAVRHFVHGRRITAQGMAADFRIDITERPSRNVAAVFDGTHYLVVVHEDPYSSAGGAHGLLITPDGQARSPLFVIIGESFRVNAVVGRPGGSLIFCDDFSTAGAVVLTLDHATRTTDDPVTIAPAWLSGVVSDGQQVLLIWTEFDGDAHVAARWLRITGAPASEPFVLSIGSQEQMKPAIALGQAVDLVVWEEVEPFSSMHAVRAARIRRNGTVIDEVPLRLSTPSIRSVRPAVVFDGVHFVVVWCEEIERDRIGRLVVRRINEDGSPIDTVPLVIANQWAESPAVAHTGDTTLITWVGYGTRPSTHGPGREVFGARLTRSGTVLDSVPLLISRDAWDHFEPDVVAGDDAFLVGWRSYRWYGHHSPVDTAASVALVTTGGTVTEPTVLEPLQTNGASAPRVAWNGSEFLAAWSAYGNGRAARITATGALSPRPGSTSAIASIPLSFVADAAFFEGSWYVVSAGDLRGVYLSPELRVEWLLPPIASPYPEVDPHVVSDGSRAVIVYRRTIEDPPYNGSGTIVFRLYDDPNVCCPLPGRRRSVRASQNT